MCVVWLTVDCAALAGLNGLSEETLREALISLETKVSIHPTVLHVDSLTATLVVHVGRQPYSYSGASDHVNKLIYNYYTLRLPKRVSNYTPQLHGLCVHSVCLLLL